MVATQLVWSEQASTVLDLVAPDPRAEIERRLDYLRSMPRMYPIADDVQFPGCRSFWVEPVYRVFYMVAAAGRDVYVVAIREEDVGELE